MLRGNEMKTMAFLFVLMTSLLVAAPTPQSDKIVASGLEIAVGGEMQIRESREQHGEVYNFQILLKKGRLIGRGCIAYRIDDPVAKGFQTRTTVHNGIVWKYAITGNTISCVGKLSNSQEAPSISLYVKHAPYIRNPESMFKAIAIKKVE